MGSGANRSHGCCAAIGAGALWLALCAGAGAQELGDAPIAAPEQPSLERPDGTPFLFSPDIFSVPGPTELSQSLNTPSGLSPFFGSRASTRGLQMTISQALRFDDNARRLATGALVPAGRSRADAFSVTNVSGSYGRDIGLQNVFVRGDFGLTRYRRNTDLDNQRYNLAAGINWRIGSPCSGSFVGTMSQSEVEYQDVALGASTSITKTERLDFNGRCRIFGNVYATFGSGAANFEVTSTPTNNSRRRFVKAGVEYDVPQLHRLGFETIYTITDFVNRRSTPLNPATTQLTQREYRGYYTYVVSPKTNLNFSGGILQAESSSALGSSSQSIPVASASVNWRPTPKLLFSLAGQIQASPPQSIQSDYQRSRSATLSIIYNYSPKLNFSAVFSQSRQTQSVFSALGGVVTGSETRLNTFSLDANYQATPFLFGGLGYRFSERTDKLSGQKVVSNLYTVTLNYRR